MISSSTLAKDKPVKMQHAGGNLNYSFLSLSLSLSLSLLFQLHWYSPPSSLRSLNILSPFIIYVSNVANIIEKRKKETNKHETDVCVQIIICPSSYNFVRVFTNDARLIILFVLYFKFFVFLSYVSISQLSIF